MKLREVFFAGNFVETLPTGSSRYLTQMYNDAKKIEEAYGSYRDAVKRGDVEKAKDILSDEREKIGKFHLVEAVKRRESSLNAAIHRIEASKTMSGAEKRRRIDELERSKGELAKKLTTR